MFLKNLTEIFTTPKYLDIFFHGLRLTLIISVGAAIMGLVLGVIVALVKLTPKENKALAIPRLICDIYITIVRGTPMALQLFIMAFVIVEVFFV